MSHLPISFAMLTDQGRVRQGNEDACAADPDAGIFVVCDGVGGAAAGEIASRVASASLVVHIAGTGAAALPARTRLLDAICSVNEAVYIQSRQDSHLAGMATTLVALLFESTDTSPAAHALASSQSAPSGTIWLANIGDSRCYRLRAGLFEQLTQDHSLVAEQVRTGTITPEQAETSPIRNIITRAIGTESSVHPDIQSLPALPGDLYLLASDGLMRELSDAEIAFILNSHSPVADHSLSAICHELISLANHRGGGDNITCLLMLVH